MNHHHHMLVVTKYSSYLVKKAATSEAEVATMHAGGIDLTGTLLKFQVLKFLSNHHRLFDNFLIVDRPASSKL